MLGPKCSITVNNIKSHGTLSKNPLKTFPHSLNSIMAYSAFKKALHRFSFIVDIMI